MLTIQPYSIRSQNYNYQTKPQLSASLSQRPKNADIAFEGNPVSKYIRLYRINKLKDLQFNENNQLNSQHAKKLNDLIDKIQESQNLKKTISKIKESNVDFSQIDTAKILVTYKDEKFSLYRGITPPDALNFIAESVKNPDKYNQLYVVEGNPLYANEKFHSQEIIADVNKLERDTAEFFATVLPQVNTRLSNLLEQAANIKTKK